MRDAPGMAERLLSITDFAGREVLDIGSRTGRLAIAALHAKCAAGCLYDNSDETPAETAANPAGAPDREGEP
jgi:ribosomal protein L11 methylase PrmA